MEGLGGGLPEHEELADRAPVPAQEISTRNASAGMAGAGRAMNHPDPITLDEAARLAEHALATAQRHPGAAVVLTPYVVRCLLDAAQAHSQRASLTTVPVLDSFTNSCQIGELALQPDVLPPTPNFVFTLGYSQQSLPDGPYELRAVALTSDQGYADYLAEQGVVSAGAKEPTHG